MLNMFACNVVLRRHRIKMIIDVQVKWNHISEFMTLIEFTLLWSGMNEDSLAGKRINILCSFTSLISKTASIAIFCVVRYWGHNKKMFYVYAFFGISIVWKARIYPGFSPRSMRMVNVFVYTEVSGFHRLPGCDSWYIPAWKTAPAEE